MATNTWGTMAVLDAEEYDGPDGTAGDAPPAFPAEDPTRYVFDLYANGYRYLDDAGNYGKSITKTGVIQSMGPGVSTKQANRILAEIHAVHGEAMVIGSDKKVAFQDGKDVLNLFRASTLKSVANQLGVDLWMKVFENVTGGDKVSLEYLLDWLALPIQSLHLKGKTTRMLTGVILASPVEGTGKGTIETLLRAIYNPVHVKAIGQDQLEARFTAFLDSALMLILNEVQGDKGTAKQTANKIKPLITDPVTYTEAKFRDASQISSVWNVMVTTNEDNAVYMTRHDRRYAVMTTKTALDPALGAQLAEDARKDGPLAAGMLDYLLKRQVKIGTGPSHLPKTEAKEDLVYLNAPSQDKFSKALLEDGFATVSHGYREKLQNDGKTLGWDANEGMVNRRDMYGVYVCWCSEEGIKPAASDKLYRTMLNLIPGMVARKVRGERGFEGIPK